MGIAPTGKPVTFVGFFTMRLVGEKRAESWELIDNTGLMKQIAAWSAHRPAFGDAPAPHSLNILVSIASSSVTEHFA